jgi:hypothetical protein
MSDDFSDTLAFLRRLTQVMERVHALEDRITVRPDNEVPPWVIGWAWMLQACMGGINDQKDAAIRDGYIAFVERTLDMIEAEFAAPAA